MPHVELYNSQPTGSRRLQSVTDTQPHRQTGKQIYRPASKEIQTKMQTDKCRQEANRQLKARDKRTDETKRQQRYRQICKQRQTDR